MRKGTPDAPSVQSLDRGLFILEAVAKSTEPVPLGDLTDLLGIDRSSVFRLAKTLKRRGFLANPNGRKDYILGPSIWRLSRKYDWSKTLVIFCHERLKLLASKTGETVHLAVREGRNALFIDHVSSPNQILVVSGQTGEFVPLYCTAHGKALLADFGIPELKTLYGNTQLQRHTPRTITTIPALAKACEQIREEGYAFDDAELIEEVRCLAAPIRDKDGVVIASVGISAPVSRFPTEKLPGFARNVSDVAKAVSSILSADSEE
jgi:IclR family acetate operon transcriptional repressor